MALFLKYGNAVFVGNIVKLNRLIEVTVEDTNEFKIKLSKFFRKKIVRVFPFVELGKFLGLGRLG